MTELALTGVGQELAAAREARGLALADVAQQLKFAPRQLEALEQERFGALPGGTFARGMVRAYARLLKIDPEPLVERMAGQVEAPPDADKLAARYHQPVPFSDSARRSTFAYLGLSLGVLVLVGALAWEWHQEREAALKTAKKTQVAVKEVPVKEAKRVTPPAPVEPKPVAVVEQKPAPAPAPKVEAAPAPTPVSPPVLVRSGPHRFALQLEGEAWIEIRDGTDRMLVSSLNPPGSERVVSGSRPPYQLVIGNASHVRLVYNDRLVDLKPHTKGDVARLTLP